MRLVCRPIIMYNEYVPAIAGERTWQYQVLGHHDGMNVLEPVYMNIGELYQMLIFSEDGGVDIIDNFLPPK